MNKTVEIILKVVLIFVLILLFLITLNSYQLDICNDYKNQYKVIFEDNLILDRCLFIENGNEYTYLKFAKLRMYDGMEIRRNK